MTASPGATTTRRCWYAGLLLACLGCAASHAATASSAIAADAVAQTIVVAIDDRPAPVPGVGSTPRGYAGPANYDGSQAAHVLATQVAAEFRLQQLAAWTIHSLRLRCMLYRIATGADPDATLAQLRADPRVRLAEPLREFSTYAAPGPMAAATYNDPYVDLQQGFSLLDAAGAHRWTQGEGRHIALIDTGVDSTHPELRGRIGALRDFVGDNAGGAAPERHGTEVAGIIAANADNGIGIVGVAPGARIDVYRACWPVQSMSGDSLCNTFTLAQALGAAIDDGARLINLSLGGPADPLLDRLLREALARGAVVLAAWPPDGRRDGFPLGVDGVIAVASIGQPNSAEALHAPGQNVLTLVPHGHFDYASGSSLATAQASAVAALLLSLRPRLDAKSLRELLHASSQATGAINACRAVLELRDQRGACATPASASP